MKILGILIVLAIAVLAIGKFIKRRAIGVPLLKCTVATSEPSHYFVKYEILHPEVKSVEYLHLVLTFGAKMLYNIAPVDADQRLAFLKAFKALGEIELANTTDVITFFQLSMNVSESACPHEASQISAVLGFKNIRQRSIWTSYPLTPQPHQAFASWISVLQTVLPKLDHRLLFTLRSSLGLMGQVFTDGSIDCASTAGFLSVPSQVFAAAFLLPRGDVETG